MEGLKFTNMAFPATNRSMRLLGISACWWATENDFPHHHKLATKSQKAYKDKETSDTQKMHN